MKKIIYICLTISLFLAVASFNALADNEDVITYNIFNTSDGNSASSTPVWSDVDNLYEDVRYYYKSTDKGYNSNANEKNASGTINTGSDGTQNWVSFLRFPIKNIMDGEVPTSAKLSVTFASDADFSSAPNELIVYGGFTNTAFGEQINYGKVDTFYKLTSLNCVGSITLSGSYTANTVLEIDITDYVKLLKQNNASSIDLALAMPEADTVVKFYHIARTGLGSNAQEYKPHITINAESDNRCGIEILYTQIRENENPVSGYSSEENHSLDLNTCINNRTSDDMENAVIIAALFDNDSMKAVSVERLFLPANSAVKHNFSIDYDYSDELNEKYKVKFFLLNSLQGLIPISSAVETYHSPVEYFTATDLTPWLKKYQFVNNKNAGEGLASGGVGQSVCSLDVSPHDDELILMGTNTVGIYRSTDGGDSFDYASDGLSYGCVNDILFDPYEPGTVYAINAAYGTNVLNEIDKYKNIGVYKSTDNGRTWEISLVAKFSRFKLGGRKQLLSATFAGKNYIYAGTMGNGIWRTADCGESWEQVYDGTEVIYDMCAGREGMLYAAGENGLLKSSDGGDTWQLNNVIVDGQAVVFQGISSSVSDGCLVGNTKNAIYFKNKNSDIWYKDSRNISSLVSAKFAKCSDDIVYLMYDAVSRPFCYISRTESHRIYKFIKDSDVGFKSGYQGSGYCITEDGEVWYNNGQLIYSSDCLGTTKKILNQQRVSGAVVTDIHFDGNGSPAIFSTLDMGLFFADTTNPAGILYPTATIGNLLAWDSSKSSSQIAVDPRNSEHILATTGNYGYSGIVRSYNGEQNIAFGSYDTFFDVIEFHSENPDIIYAGYKRSDDNGNTWHDLYIKRDDPETSDIDESILANIKAVSKKNSDILLTFKNKLLYVSSDCGETWTEHNLTKLDGNITYAMFDLFDDNTIWISGLSSIFTYDYVNGILKVKYDESETKSIREIAQNPRNKNHLLAINKDVFSGQNNYGLYESSDGGESWKVLDGIPSLSEVANIIFNPVEPVVYLGSHIGTLVYDYECYHKFINACKDYGSIIE